MALPATGATLSCEMSAPTCNWLGYRVESPEGLLGVVESTVPGQPTLLLVRTPAGRLALVHLDDVGWVGARERVVALNGEPTHVRAA